MVSVPPTAVANIVVEVTAGIPKISDVTVTTAGNVTVPE
jgi:hypothetical protein